MGSPIDNIIKRVKAQAASAGQASSSSKSGGAGQASGGTTRKPVVNAARASAAENSLQRVNIGDEKELFSPKTPEERLEELRQLTGDPNRYGKHIKTITDELTDEQYGRCIELLNRDDLVLDDGLGSPPGKTGITINDLITMAQFEDEQYARVGGLLDRGVASRSVITIAQLEDDKYPRIDELFGRSISFIPDVLAIAQLEDNQYNRCIELLDRYNLRLGSDFIFPSGVTFIDIKDLITIAQLEDDKYARVGRLFDQGISPRNVLDISQLEDEQYAKVDGLLGWGIMQAPDALAIARLENDKYEKCIVLLDSLQDDREGDFTFEYKELQNDAGEEIVISKTYRTDASTVTIINTIRNDGEAIQEQREEYDDGIIKSSYIGSSIYYEHQGDYVVNSRGKRYPEMDTQIQIITDNSTGKTQIYYTKAADPELLAGAFDITLYELEGYDGTNADLIQALKDGQIENGIPLAQTVRNPDGSVTYTENFEINGSQVQRAYTQLTDDDGSLIRSEYSYKVVDASGDTILNLERSFEKNPDGTTTTVINGKTYVASFDDETQTITINNGTEVTTINIREKITHPDNDKTGQQILWETCKNLPADLIHGVGQYINQWVYCDDLDSRISASRGILYSSANTYIIAHEIGHAEDYYIPLLNNGKSPEVDMDEPARLKESSIILEYPDLVDIYNEEIDNFKDIMTSVGQDYIYYFSQTGGSSGVGLNEFIAETRMLLTAYGHDTNAVRARAHFLIHYFPKTIARIAEILDLSGV